MANGGKSNTRSELSSAFDSFTLLANKPSDNAPLKSDITTYSSVSDGVNANCPTSHAEKERFSSDLLEREEQLLLKEHVRTQQLLEIVRKKKERLVNYGEKEDMSICSAYSGEAYSSNFSISRSGGIAINSSTEISSNMENSPDNSFTASVDMDIDDSCDDTSGFSVSEAGSSIEVVSGTLNSTTIHSNSFHNQSPVLPDRNGVYFPYNTVNKFDFASRSFSQNSHENICVPPAPFFGVPVIPSVPMAVGSPFIPPLMSHPIPPYSSSRMMLCAPVSIPTCTFSPNYMGLPLVSSHPVGSDQMTNKQGYTSDGSPHVSSKTNSKPTDANIRSANRKEILERRNKLDEIRNRQREKRRMEQTDRDFEENHRSEYSAFTRSVPAETYLVSGDNNVKKSTEKMQKLVVTFRKTMISKQEIARAKMGKNPEPPKKWLPRVHTCHKNDEMCSSDSESDKDEEEMEQLCEMAMQRKRTHPEKLRDEIWFNEAGEMNDGPACRCSLKTRGYGIRHDYYPGERPIVTCDLESNNIGSLFHYVINFTPSVNLKNFPHPTKIYHDGHDFIFDGFSLFSHSCLDNLPDVFTNRFSFRYKITLQRSPPPESFTVSSLDTFTEWLFGEVLELLDMDWRGRDIKTGCHRIHFMPRFARPLPGNGTELLSMPVIMRFCTESFRPLLDPFTLEQVAKMDEIEWLAYLDDIKSELVSFPGMRPAALRIDHLDRGPTLEDSTKYPLIVHFGIKPMQLAWFRNQRYRKLSKEVMKWRHLLACKPRVTREERSKLSCKERQLRQIRLSDEGKMEVTVEMSCEGFYKIGLKGDICQNALMLPVILMHIRFHESLHMLEKSIEYKFKDRHLLQLALTHPSYRSFHGTNTDHMRNSITNCGARVLKYGLGVQNLASGKRKRGVTVLMNIMSQMGKRKETLSEVDHNERLEYLGDAVVEVITTSRLFYMFPKLQEGGLALYRSALVRNRQLAELAHYLELQKFLLLWHGPDICHESDLRHAMANAFEALIGALFLDGGLEVADKLFAKVSFVDPVLYDVWYNLSPLPLQLEEPDGDRHWISKSPYLQKLVRLENSLGIKFRHIRLCARALTPRTNLAYNHLTCGHNERLEFLGDAVLQLIVSDYLYRHFPDHHEGHLTLLRSALVNNRTQSVMSDDLNLMEYTISKSSQHNDEEDSAGKFGILGAVDIKTRADLFEAFLGSLYVDKDLYFCQMFCHSVIFPRLKYFILGRHWSDPKSELQQMCLTLRNPNGGNPDMPIYKTVECSGPSNTRVYTVAVYFRTIRLATGLGHSIQDAQMNAASLALKNHEGLFPQLRRQKSHMRRLYGDKAGEEMRPIMFGVMESSASEKLNRVLGGLRMQGRTADLVKMEERKRMKKKRSSRILTEDSSGKNDDTKDLESYDAMDNSKNSNNRRKGNVREKDSGSIVKLTKFGPVNVTKESSQVESDKEMVKDFINFHQHNPDRHRDYKYSQHVCREYSVSVKSKRNEYRCKQVSSTKIEAPFSSEPLISKSSPGGGNIYSSGSTYSPSRHPFNTSEVSKDRAKELCNQRDYFSTFPPPLGVRMFPDHRPMYPVRGPPPYAFHSLPPRSFTNFIPHRSSLSYVINSTPSAPHQSFSRRTR